MFVGSQHLVWVEERFGYVHCDTPRWLVHDGWRRAQWGQWPGVGPVPLVAMVAQPAMALARS